MGRTRTEPRHARRAVGALLALISAVALVALGLSSPAAAGPAARTAAAAVPAPRSAADALPLSTTSYRRLCPAVHTAGVMSCLVSAKAAPGLAPAGHGAADITSAYKLPTTGGAGRTVAIVDAYNDPNAESDLAQYRSQYGLGACTTANGCFTKVNQNGAASPLPASDSGWGLEISLDVDMVSAACPSCHILLVEVNSPTIANLGTGVNTAVRLGAVAVSNSYGGDEYAGETSADHYYKHKGVAVTVSSGDSGYNGGVASYPATSATVTAVGGTNLTKAGNSRGWTETAWVDAGSGCSKYEAKPARQNGVATGCAKRAEADVSAVSVDLATYDTFGYTGFIEVNGTSASSPIIAAVFGLAGRPAAGSYPARYPYNHTGNLFDVTSGSNGSCGAPLCQAGPGYDGPTGLGTPNGVTAFRP